MLHEVVKTRSVGTQTDPVADSDVSTSDKLVKQAQTNQGPISESLLADVAKLMETWADVQTDFPEDEAKISHSPALTRADVLNHDVPLQEALAAMEASFKGLRDDLDKMVDKLLDMIPSEKPPAAKPQRPQLGRLNTTDVQLPNFDEPGLTPNKEFPETTNIEAQLTDFHRTSCTIEQRRSLVRDISQLLDSTQVKRHSVGLGSVQNLAEVFVQAPRGDGDDEAWLSLQREVMQLVGKALERGIDAEASSQGQLEIATALCGFIKRAELDPSIRCQAFELVRRELDHARAFDPAHKKLLQELAQCAPEVASLGLWNDFSSTLRTCRVFLSSGDESERFVRTLLLPNGLTLRPQLQKQLLRLIEGQLLKLPPKVQNELLHPCLKFSQFVQFEPAVKEALIDLANKVVLNADDLTRHAESLPRRVVNSNTKEGSDSQGVLRKNEKLEPWNNASEDVRPLFDEFAQRYADNQVSQEVQERAHGTVKNLLQEERRRFDSAFTRAETRYQRAEAAYNKADGDVKAAEKQFESVKNQTDVTAAERALSEARAIRELHANTRDRIEPETYSGNLRALLRPAITKLKNEEHAREFHQLMMDERRRLKSQNRLPSPFSPLMDLVGKLSPGSDGNDPFLALRQSNKVETDVSPRGLTHTPALVFDSLDAALKQIESHGRPLAEGMQNALAFAGELQQTLVGLLDNNFGEARPQFRNQFDKNIRLLDDCTERCESLKPRINDFIAKGDVEADAFVRTAELLSKLTEVQVLCNRLRNKLQAMVDEAQRKQ